MSGSRPWIAAVGLLALMAPAARGQVAFAPQVGAFPNGAVLSATPAVSFDRRYVRLGMNPQFTVLEGFDPFLVPAAVSSGPGGPLAGGGGAGGGNSVGFAGMNGPIADPDALSSLPQGVRGARGASSSAPGFNGSSDFEDQLRPTAAPVAKAVARPALSAKAKRKAAIAKRTKGSRPPRTTAKSAQPR